MSSTASPSAFSAPRSPTKNREAQVSIEIPVLHAELGNTPDDVMVPTTSADELDAPRHQTPAFRFPWMRAACAAFMLVASVVIGISAAVVQSLAAGVVAILLFLPGAYTTWAYFQAYRGNPYYTRDQWLGLERNTGAEDDHNAGTH